MASLPDPVPGLHNGDDEIHIDIDSPDEARNPLTHLLEFQFFKLDDLVAATNNFDSSNLLGKGAQGEVFAGNLDGRMIAVKRLPEVAWRVHEEAESLQKEIRSIAAINHKNILQLLGFCLEGDTPLLICPKLYSLHKALANDTEILSWEARYEIAIGVAKGLAYLHKEARIPMIHCDIKPANILLDPTTFQPCIADFGLVHLLAHQDRNGSVDAATLYGTPGYMAPEIRSARRFSVKADVYSFGKLLYAIVSGKDDVRQLSDTLQSKKTMFAWLASKKHNFLAALWVPWAWGRVLPHTMVSLFSVLVFINGTKLNDVDGRLWKNVGASGRSTLQAYKALDVIAICTQDDPRVRPNMEHVVLALESANVCSVPFFLWVVAKLGPVMQRLLVGACGIILLVTPNLAMFVRSPDYLLVAFSLVAFVFAALVVLLGTLWISSALLSYPKKLISLSALPI